MRRAAVTEYSGLPVASIDTVQHLGYMPHLTRGLSNLRPMPTCSVEGAHAERLREILACWARQHPLSPALRVQEGALHDLADHDNIAADEDAERFDDLDDDDRGVDAASWLAASDVGHAICCLALLRVSDGIDGMSWQCSDRGTAVRGDAQARVHHGW